MPRWLFLALAVLIAARVTAPWWLVVPVDAGMLFAGRVLPHAEWRALPGRRRISLGVAPGVTLRGYDFTLARPRAFVIFFHGNAGRLDQDVPFLSWLRGAAHVDVVDYDYRGCGLSDGRLSIAAIRSDTRREAALLLARARAAERPAIVYGFSLGTAVATDVAAHLHVDGLVLQAPPSDIETQIAVSSRPFAPVLALTGARARIDPGVRDLLATAARIATVRAPLLVIHGTADRTVDITEGRAVYAAAASPEKRFVAISGLDHLGWIPPTAGGRAVTTFIDRLARPRRRPTGFG